VATAEEKPDLSEHYVLTRVEQQRPLCNLGQSAIQQEGSEGAGETPTAAGGLVLQQHQGPADESLVQLALQAGWSSRFCVDSRFGRAAFEALNKRWIDRSCTHEIADVVLTASLGQGCVGLITATLKPPTAKICLIAVNGDAQGLGVGWQLMERVASLALEAGCESLTVVTQLQNAPATGLYGRVGFQQSQLMHWYHVWSDQGEMA
jgi:ribosomal protein S18 acetylase RimI-like enzyme